MRCRYNAVDFLKHSHKIHTMARPLGRNIGCLLCAPTLIYIWSQSLQWCMQYHAILYRCTRLYKIMQAISHKCLNFNESIIKPPVKSWHELMHTSHRLRLSLNHVSMPQSLMNYLPDINNIQHQGWLSPWCWMLFTSGKHPIKHQREYVRDLVP